MCDSKGSPQSVATAPGVSSKLAGTISLISGCMFAGKTTELLRRLDHLPSEQIVAVKHVIDRRYRTDAIATHNGAARSATPIASASDIVPLINERTRIVAIDEAHFFDARLPGLCVRLTARGIDVIATSLDPDSWGRTFPHIQELRSLADELIALRSTCARCGGQADRTQRKTPIVNGDLVGGSESYEPRCKSCWRPPPEPAPQK